MVRLIKYFGIPEERFWNKVKIGKENECWEWVGHLTVKGYGMFKVGTRKLSSSHRFSYELHFREIPKGICVLHHCDNRKCVNPKHLFLGTNSDNVADKVKKNRQSRGTNNPNSVLTWKQVNQIRKLYSQGIKNVELSKKFNIDNGRVSRIVHNKLWKELV